MASPQHASLKLSAPAALPCATAGHHPRDMPLTPFPVVLEAARRPRKGPLCPRKCSTVRLVPTWDSLSPGEKQAWLLNQALDCKRDILTLPLPDPNDDSAEARWTRSLILAAADSTIEQTIRLRTNLLTPSAADADVERVLEARLQRAREQIEEMDAEQGEYGYDASPKSN
jgi:hypothetical protein